MNKTLIGCLVVLLLVGISGAVGAYYFLWRPAKALVTEVAKLQEIPKLNQQVRKTAAFNPPTDNVLTNDAVERFVRTQNDIKTKLGARIDELSAKYRLLEQRGPNYRPTWSELAGAYKDFAGLIVEAKRAQVDALNQNSFSVAEYNWTRQRVYEAAGIPINFDFEKVLRAISEGNTSASEKQTSSELEAQVTVPEKNRTLVAPYAKELLDRAALPAFGL